MIVAARILIMLAALIGCSHHSRSASAGAPEPVTECQESLFTSFTPPYFDQTTVRFLARNIERRRAGFSEVCLIQRAFTSRRVEETLLLVNQLSRNVRDNVPVSEPEARLHLWRYLSWITGILGKEHNPFTPAVLLGLKEIRRPNALLTLSVNSDWIESFAGRMDCDTALEEIAKVLQEVPVDQKDWQQRYLLSEILNNKAVCEGRVGLTSDAVRDSEAVLVMKRSLFPARAPELRQILNNTAAHNVRAGNLARARQLYEEALEIAEALSPDDLYIGWSLRGLAKIETLRDRDDIAEGHLRRAFDIWNREHLETWTDRGILLVDLADTQIRQEKYKDALIYVTRAEDVFSLSLAPDHPLRQRVLDRRAVALHGLGREAEALLIARDLISSTPEFTFSYLHMISSPDGSFGELTEEAFRRFQAYNKTSMDKTMAGVLKRVQSGSPALAGLIREQQDVAEKIDRDTHDLSSLLLDPASADKASELRGKLAQLRDRRETIQQSIQSQFPRYSSEQDEPVLTVAEIQLGLRPSECLVSLHIALADLVSDNVAFLVCSDTVRGSLIARKSSDLRRRITELRQSITSGLEATPAAADGEMRVAENGARLYEELLGSFSRELEGRRRIVFHLSGAAALLPPAVLVDAPPSTDDEPSWLVKRFAISVVPSLAVFRASPAPLRQQPTKQMLAMADTRAGTEEGMQARRTSAGAQLQPLPETAAEVRSVGKRLGSDKNDILLGAMATKSALTSRSLGDYRVLYFATHAIMGGEFGHSGPLEPALALSSSPGTGEEDTWLTASEITELNLQADLVVLSACSTAAAARPGAEPLSGLARAFIYAGARSLLVSHWPVDSRSAVVLMGETFRQIDGVEGVDLDEALRRAMVSVMHNKFNPRWSNPAYWAPFFLVGRSGDFAKVP